MGLGDPDGRPALRRTALEHIVPDALVHLARPASPRLIRAVCASTRGDWTLLTRAFLETLCDFPWGPKPRGAVDLA